MRFLHLEDSDADAELIRELISREWPEVDIVRAQTQGEYMRALADPQVALVLADFALPSFDGLSALSFARELRPDIPFIFLSGAIGEETAVETLRHGATDYILKDRIGRLIPAILRALVETDEPFYPADPGQEPPPALQILHLEDSSADAEMIRALIEREWPGVRIQLVKARADFTAGLQNKNLDLILSDFSMPGFDGLSALAIARGLRPDVPFIFLSGTIGEENAVAGVKNGATDYILKDRMRRLRPAIRRALNDRKRKAAGPSTRNPFGSRWDGLFQGPSTPGGN
jgi:CheY-like chemotaxis protein